MPYKSLHLTALLCLMSLLLAASGCSRVSIAYNSADFLIEQYAKDYLALEGPQIASWQPTLENALSRHRQEDLPYLARFFDDAHEGAVKGFNQPRMQCLLDQFEVLYRRHARVAADLTAPLLAELTPDQIQALEKKFREEKAEDEADMDRARVARQKRKRAERYEESVTWWIGPLSEKQKIIVSEQTAAMPDTDADWIQYRNAERKVLIELLKRQAGEKEIRDFLVAWVVQHKDLPQGLQEARKKIRGQIAELFIRLDNSFSTEQRAHFAARLAGLRDEFLSLQQQPRMATVECADSSSPDRT